MLRFIFMALLLSSLLSCNKSPFDEGDSRTPEVRIQTEKDSYAVENGWLSITVSFFNQSAKDYYLSISGCGFPAFIIEKNINENWQEAGGPACIALAMSPEHLSRFEKFTSVLQLPADNIQADPLAGVYRLRFYLADKEGNPLSPEKSISNHFSIVP